MISLKDASQIAVIEIAKILDLVKMKFETIEYDPIISKDSFCIKCNLKAPNKEVRDIIIRFLPDYERRNPKIPKNLKEYFDGGGGGKSEEKLNNSDDIAWKCQVVSNLTNGQKLEYGIALNEKNFSNKLILSLFDRFLLGD